MDTKQRITHTQAAIAKVEFELAALHAESQQIQRGGHIAPSSAEPAAIALAARQSALSEAEAQQKLTGVNAAVASLQNILGQYQRELAGLRQLEKEALEREAANAAKSEFEAVAAELNKLSTKMEQVMVALHQSGLRWNKASGSLKYDMRTNVVPAHIWDRGAHYLSTRTVNFRQADELPLASPAPANPALAPQRNEQLQLQAQLNQQELAVSELKEEVAGHQLRLRSYGTNPQGLDKQWAESLAYRIQEKQLELKQATDKLQELKKQVGEAHAR